MEKSYVTLALCPICREESGELLLDRRLKPVFDMHTILPTGVCKKCRKKYLTKGIMLINPETAALVVLRDEAFARLFNKPVPKSRIVFCEQGVIDKINQLNTEAQTA